MAQASPAQRHAALPHHSRCLSPGWSKALMAKEVRFRLGPWCWRAENLSGACGHATACPGDGREGCSACCAVISSGSPGASPVPPTFLLELLPGAVLPAGCWWPVGVSSGGGCFPLREPGSRLCSPVYPGHDASAPLRSLSATSTGVCFVRWEQMAPCTIARH